MTPEELIATSFIGLPERVHKLERTVFEYNILLRMLLARSGLDEAAVERAFADVADSVERYSQEKMERTTQEWLATPEGQEARRKASAEFRARQKELWREDCREDRRIYPDPTKTQGQ